MVCPTCGYFQLTHYTGTELSLTFCLLLYGRYVEYYVEHLGTYKAHDKDGIAHDEGGIVEGGASDMRCVQDCLGDYPCHGRPSSYKELYDTFQTCCEHHTWWITDCSLPYHDANGNSNSGKWFVKYESPGVSQCVMDCDGPDVNCGGKAALYDELYETFTECCELHLWWTSTDCAISPSNETGSGGEQHYSFKYFTDYMTGSCLQDCDPGSDEGAIVCKEIPPPVVLYDDVTDCCDIGQSWVDISYCTSRSVGIYSEGWVVNYENSKCGESYHMKLFILSPKLF